MEILKEFAEKYNVTLNDEKIKLFEMFYNFLLEENKKYNLTTITDKKEFVVKHVIDSLLPYNMFDKNVKVIDIGCGAGFPSIPLKILREDLNFTMIDSVNKKVNFCNMSIEKLGLEKAVAVHSRVEDFALKNREVFDVCCSRAVANLSTLLEYALPLLKVGGICIFYKAQNVEEEIIKAQNALNVLGGKVEKVEHYNLEGNERNVLVIKKVKLTLKNYPRGQNKPRIKPL